ncbi:MAG: NAD-binding protein [Kiritimatiellia bacterium]
MIMLDPVHPAGRTLRQRFGLLVLALLAVATCAIGTLGFTQYQAVSASPYSLADAFYQSLQLFTLESGVIPHPIPWPLKIARFLAPVLTFTAVAQALAVIFHSEVRNFRLSRSRGHIVICGAGTKASALIRDYCCGQQRVIIIDSKASQVLQDVPAQADVFAIRGDATDGETLRQARAERAERVFITTGNDSVNIEIAASLMRHCKASASRAGRVACHIHLVDRQTEELFKRHRIFKDAAAQIDMHTFNVYDNAARLLWRERLQVCGPLAPDDARSLHTVIGGLGQMGEAVLLRLVRSAHYANGLKPTVTIIDLQAALCKEHLLARYPALPHHCNLAFIQADLDRPQAIKQITEILTKPGQITSVVLCLDDDHANFAIALRLAPHLKAHATPIFIRLTRAAGLCELLQAEHSDSALARQIDGFGLTGTCCTRELVLTDELSRMARVFHEAYIVDRQAAGDTTTGPSRKTWESLDEAFRESNREQAEHLELKLLTFDYSATDSRRGIPVAFTDEQLQILGRMEHARWCAERELAGWGYAPGPKSVDTHTSPDIVPWNSLSPDVRKIDFDVVTAIPRLLAALSCPPQPEK